uniref:hypothetical protein n=1 Tax=Streptomyces sp. NBC_01001 TaxID=2903713 RepID=UPI002F90BA77|nr:hypothetical protein OG296_38895 [Streptomyces sp. NBC_01001]
MDVGQVLGECSPQCVTLRSQLPERIGPLRLALVQEDGRGQLFDDRGAEVHGGAGLCEALKERRHGANPYGHAVVERGPLGVVQVGGAAQKSATLPAMSR